MASIRRPGWPMSSPVSPPIRFIGSTNCYPGIGRHHRQRSPLELHDHAHQQGPSRHHITRLAQDLGEDEDWLWDVANEMHAEDGLIWVYGVGDEGVMAFTDFGVETLMELIKIHKEDPKQASTVSANPSDLRPTPDGYAH